MPMIDLESSQIYPASVVPSGYVMVLNSLVLSIDHSVIRTVTVLVTFVGSSAKSIISKDSGSMSYG